MRLSLRTPPAGKVVSLTEAFDHLEIDEDQEELHHDHVDALLEAATEDVERRAARQLLTAGWTVEFDRFPCYSRAPIIIPLPPLQAIAEVRYVDGTGASQVWGAAEYTVNKPVGPYAREGQLYPKFDKVYPSTACVANAIAIDFTAGYGASAAVPPRIKQAILLLMRYWFEHPDSASSSSLPLAPPAAVDAIVESFRTPTSVMA